MACPAIRAGQSMRKDAARVARPERFELPTSWFVAMRSIQLSYGRIREKARYYLEAPLSRQEKPAKE